MTVNTTPVETNYTGNASTTVFALTFAFAANAHVKVYLAGVLQNSGYSITGAGNPSGGTLTFSAAPGNGVAIKARRVTPLTQDIDVVNNATVFASSLETGLDYALLRQQEEVFDRVQLGITFAIDAAAVAADAASAVASAASALASKNAAEAAEANAETAEANAQTAQGLSEDARDLSQQYAADAAIVSGVNVPIYASVATAEGSTIVAGVKSIRTQYRAPTYADLSTLVGGGDYARVSLAALTGYPAASYFRSTDRFMPDGTTDATNGGYWLLSEDEPTPQMLGGVGDGVASNTTVYQGLIDYATARGLARLSVPPGDWSIPGSLTGGSGLTWFLEPGAEVTPGKLPGRVVPAAPPTWGPPQSVWVFGETPYTFGTVTFTSGASVTANSSSGAVTLTTNGICSNDRLTATFRGWTDGLVPQLVEPSGRNTLSARLWNVTGSSISYGSRTAAVTVASNSAYRQVFALSRSQSKDCWLAGVDMEGVKSACVWFTNNAGASWRPRFAVSANAIRNFVEVTANSNTSGNDTLNTVMLAAVADPNTVTELAWRSTDAFATASAIAFTRSGSNGETVLLDGDVEGGQGLGSGSSRVIMGSFRPSNAPATAFVSTDGGVSFGSPIEIAPATTYDSCWGMKWISGAGASSVWLAFLHRNDATTLAPAVYRSTDGGSTWALLATVGAVGDEWQGITKLANGTLLAGLDSSDGGVYRSTDNGANWTKTFACVPVVSADSKARCFAESNGAVYMGTQDSGHLWRSDDDGLTWVCEWRLAQQSAPICMSASTNIMLIGCGQGYTTSTASRAEMIRLIRAPFRHQYG